LAGGKVERRGRNGYRYRENRLFWGGNKKERRRIRRRIRRGKE